MLLTSGSWQRPLCLLVCARATGGEKTCAGGSGAAKGLRGPRLLLRGSSPASRPREELLPQLAFPPGGREAAP